MPDLRRSYPVTLLWGVLAPGQKVPVIYDHEFKLIDAFVDYGIAVSARKAAARGSEQAYKSTIEAVAYALTDLAEFMQKKRVSWRDFDDELLQEYRDSSLAETLKNARARDDLSARRTVNVRLRHIYQFFTWAQVDALLVDRLIGWRGCRVRSTLPSLRGAEGPRRIDAKDREKYPLCFRPVGEGSRTAGQHYTTDEDIERLEAYFWDTEQLETGERNVLMLHLVQHVGWRRASLNGLKIDQFSDDAINNAERAGEDLRVVPARQKFGYRNTFDVPLALACHINRYIKTSRAELLHQNGWNESIAKRRLFVSATTGAPLSDGSVSQIFGEAFRAIGAPKGAGLHSVRRGYGTLQAELELEVRKRERLSTAPEDVMLAVARRLGHQSIESQEPYVRAVLTVSRDSLEERQRREILAKSVALSDAHAKIARLEVLVNRMPATATPVEGSCHRRKKNAR
jgi:hypothetical protein